MVLAISGYHGRHSTLRSLHNDAGKARQAQSPIPPRALRNEGMICSAQAVMTLRNRDSMTIISDKNSPAGLSDYALLLALSMIWGSSFLFIKLGVDTIPPATLTACRLGVAAALMVVIARLAGQSLPRDGRIWTLIAASALFGNALPFTLITWGEETIDSGLAAILMAVMPLSTVLLAHVFTRDEPLTVRKSIGVLLGFIGLIILIGPEKLLHLGDDTVRQLAVAAAAFCYGINALVTKHLLDLPRRALAAGVLLASTIMIIPISLFLESPWNIQPSTISMTSVILLGVVHTAVTTMMMFALIRRQGASFFSQLNFLVPPFGVLWGAMILAERPPANAYVALATILLGIACARGRQKPRE